MIKKPTEKKRIQEDFTALDAAVIELNKQTEALLGKTNEKTSKKPVLPKKKNLPVSRGKSFDIIRDSNKKSVLQGTLKTAKAAPVAPTTSEVVQKKPSEQTFLDDSETGAPQELVWLAQESVAQEESSPAVVIKRRGGSLITMDSSGKDDEPPEVDQAEDDAEDTAVATAEPSKSTLGSEKQNSSVEPEGNAEAVESQGDPAPLAEPEEAQVPEEKDSPVVDPVLESEVKDPVTAEPSAYNSGELFANNLVKESGPRGYEADEKQQKPTVFDTNEYHPELHDWSKLDRSNNPKWVLLVLLLIFGVGVVYFVVLGQPLPF